MLGEKIQFGTFKSKPLFYSVDKGVVFDYKGKPDKFRYTIFVSFWHAKKSIGGISMYVKPFSDAMDETRCFDLMFILLDQYSVLRNQPVVSVQSSGLDKAYRNKGLGTKLYKISIESAWRIIGEPFFFSTDWCEMGDTSKQAEKVWMSLAKEFPTASFSQRIKDPHWAGTVVGVIEPFTTDKKIVSYKNPISRKNRSMLKKSKKGVRDKYGRFIPQKYIAGFKGKKLKQRIEEIGDRRQEYKDALKQYGDEDNFPRKVSKSLFRAFETDKGAKSKRSPYTKEAHRRGFDGNLDKKAESASSYYGSEIPVNILRTIFNRGKSAWASGGHRKGQTPESWGYARVNSFLVGGKTFWTADSDQRRKLIKMGSEKAVKGIASESIYDPSLGVIFDFSAG